MIFINFIKKSIEVNKFLLILCFWIQFGNCVFANEGETLIGRNIEVADIEFYHLAYAESTSVAQLDSLNQAYNSAITDPLSKILNLFAYSKALSKRGKSNIALQKLNVLTPYLSQFDNYLLGEYYATISSINYFSENPKKAHEYLKRSIKYTLKANNNCALHSRYSSLGIVFLALNNVDSAFVYFDKAEQLNASATPKNRLYLELNIALANSTIKNYERAKVHFKRALNSFEQYPDLFAQVRTYGNLGDIYIKQDSISEGLELYYAGLQIAKKNGYNLGEIRFHKSLADVLYAQNKPNEAYKNLVSYLTLRDQLSMEETSEKIEEMDMNFKLIAKERENEYQTRLYFLETQKSTILWVLAFLLIAGILTLYRQLLKLKAKNEVLFKLGLKEKSLIEKKKETDDSYSELISAFECLMIDKRIFEKSNLTIDSVSKKLGTNRTYLSEAINAHYNVSYSRWVNELRIQESKKYLASKEHDCYCIDGISKMVGFSSISAFNSNFKSITGLTPSYYRKRSVSS